MSKQMWKGSTLMAPVPVMLVTCGDFQKPNIMTAAWTGIVCSDPPMAYVSVRRERLSHALISRTGTFALNLTTKELVKAADFCGVKSGREVDKIKHLGLSVSLGSNLCPLLDQSPVSLECCVVKKLELGVHDMFLAEIVAVHAEADLLDEDGKLHLERSGLIAYSHGDYVELGKTLGTFGYSVRKKERKKECKKEHEKEEKPVRRAAARRPLSKKRRTPKSGL